MLDQPLRQAAGVVRNTIDGGPKPVVRTFFDESTNTATHVVHDPITRVGAVIDSVLNYDSAAGRLTHLSADRVVAYIAEAKLSIAWHLETHAHADHFSAAPYLQEKVGGALAIGEQITRVQSVFGKVFNAGSEFAPDGSQFDHLIRDGDSFQIGELTLVALSVPGHTPADMTYVIGDAAFVGDTLFMPDYGTARADFPGGDARQLYRSIQRLLSLPDETRIFLCHDYKSAGRDIYVWETTVAAERAANVHVHQGISEDEFVAMRNARDATLPMPKLILPSIQVNMRAGHLPDPEQNGTRYLKIPLDTI